MKITLACAAAAAFAAAALVGAPSALATPEEDAFLSVIGDEGITWAPDKTPQVIETGHAVCEDWDNGATLAQEVSDLIEVTGWTDAQAQTFVGAATGAFCASYTFKLEG
jgi:hypothetical protein